ncbi:hypothetical protein ACQZEU_12650, partial [Corynebacterium diphtheriae]
RPQDLYIFGGAITAGASVSWFREQFCQAEEQQVDARHGLVSMPHVYNGRRTCTSLAARLLPVPR